jgi:DNA-binding transcriptional ArsR family regulator
MKLSLITTLTNACANQSRLEILKFLKYKKYGNVSTIARGINVSIKSTSKHLLHLHQVHIIKREREGVEIFYSLNKPLNVLVKNIINFL